MSLLTVWDTLRSVGVADVLDVGLMAVLLYVLFLWFERTRVAFVARGMLVLILFYFAAKLGGMYMTTWVIQGFFAVILIAPVVIFAEEIRRFFERIAVWSLGESRGEWSGTDEDIDAVVRALGKLARSKIGGLVVIKGRDPLLRHVEGGIEVDARISSPLLESLFDPHSDGHDGAVVIEQGRISHFAAHLPLSNDFRQLAGKGTRHAAALGLAERTDALCLVVSEERGTIYGAKDGSLFPLKDLPQLEGLLASFLHQRAAPPPAAEPVQVSFLPPKLREKLLRFDTFRELDAASQRASAYLQEKVKLPTHADWRRLVHHRGRQKAACLGLSLALWLVFVKGFKPLTQDFTMPVAVQNVPEHLSVRSVHPSQLSVALLGSPRNLRALKPRHLSAYVDLTDAVPGTHTIVIGEDHLRVPSSLELISVVPQTVEIELAPAGGPSAKLVRRVGKGKSR